jgi:hypothetical protein
MVTGGGGADPWPSFVSEMGLGLENYALKKTDKWYVMSPDEFSPVWLPPPPPEAVSSLRLKKKMKWGTKGLQFIDQKSVCFVYMF